MTLLCPQGYTAPLNISGELLPPEFMQHDGVSANIWFYWNPLGITLLFDFAEEQTENHGPSAWP
jgi:hypothetical protein